MDFCDLIGHRRLNEPVPTTFKTQEKSMVEKDSRVVCNFTFVSRFPPHTSSHSVSLRIRQWSFRHIVCWGEKSNYWGDSYVLEWLPLKEQVERLCNTIVGIWRNECWMPSAVISYKLYEVGSSLNVPLAHWTLHWSANLPFHDVSQLVDQISKFQQKRQKIKLNNNIFKIPQNLTRRVKSTLDQFF